MSGIYCYVAQICIFLTFFLIDVQPKIFKRQITVKSDSLSNATADVVYTSAAASHFKNAGGEVGADVSSSGKTTGNRFSAIDNSASESVGSLNVKGSGRVEAKGDSTSGQSDITGHIVGRSENLTISQTGTANGKGDTSVSSRGTGEISDRKSNAMVMSGATGSKVSHSQVKSNQKLLSLDKILSDLTGKAFAEGITNSQANVQLKDGGFDISGLVFGVNNGKDSDIKTQSSGSTNSMNSNAFGQISGTSQSKGDSSLTGAQTVQNKNKSLTVFGSSQVNTKDGNGDSKLLSKANISDEITHSFINVKGNSQGTLNNKLTVSSGIRANDKEQKSEIIGNGAMIGSGSVQSIHTIDSNIKYNGDEKTIKLDSKGLAISNDNQTSFLNMNANGKVDNKSIVINSTGEVKGENNSNVSGSAQITGSGARMNSDSSFTVQGGGKGPSKALSGIVVEADGKRFTARGSVTAIGDETMVVSSSQVRTRMSREASLRSSSSSKSSNNASTLTRTQRSVRDFIFQKFGPEKRPFIVIS